MALLILAALQMMPHEIYEVAKLDGVSPWKVFWRVTLPLIRPALMVAVIFRAPRRAAHLRPDLRADAEQRADQVDVGVRAREPVRVRQVRLRLRRLDPAVRHPDRADHALSSGSAASAWTEAAEHADRQAYGLLPARRGHRRDRRLPVLLRRRHQPEIRARRCSRSTTGRRIFSLNNYIAVVHQGHVPAQPRSTRCSSRPSVVVISLFLGVTAAYALARIRFPAARRCC